MQRVADERGAGGCTDERGAAPMTSAGRWAVALGYALGLLCAADSLAAQAAAAGPAELLPAIEASLRDGDVSAARARLLEWFDTYESAAGREAQQHAIWLRGLLTLDPGQAVEDYRRLVIDFAGGPWSDRALERLALIAEASGDLRAAARRWERLMRDYPSSSLRDRARTWLSLNARELAAAEVPTPAPDAEAAGSFTVQVGAFVNPARAMAVVDRLARLDRDARRVIVPGSDLVRVRVGRFTTRAEADALVAELLAAGLDARVAADAPAEVPYR